MANPSIAIIGLEGSGKTVLMSVLAKRLSVPKDGCYLDPVGIQTMKRVEGTWAALQRGEWPPSTPPGEMFSLNWKLYIKRYDQKVEADIRLIDLAGQDTRQLFNNDDIRRETREHLKPIAEYLANASIVLFALNIKDYIAETDDERRIENQAVLKSALDQLNGSKKILLVFTQYDQYETFVNECGGLEAFCRKHIPYIYNAYLSTEENVFGTQRIPTLCLSAVSDTQVQIGADSIARRVPVPNFSSRGLDELCKWIVEDICAPYKEEQERKEKERKEQEKREQERQEQERKEREQQEKKRQTKFGCLGMVIGTVFSFMPSVMLGALVEQLGRLTGSKIGAGIGTGIGLVLWVLGMIFGAWLGGRITKKIAERIAKKP